MSPTQAHISQHVWLSLFLPPLPVTSPCRENPVFPGDTWSRGQERTPASPVIWGQSPLSWHSGQLWGWPSPHSKAVAT